MQVPQLLKHRFLPLWILCASLIILGLYLHGIGETLKSFKLGGLRNVGYSIDEGWHIEKSPKANGVIVILVSPSRISQTIAAIMNIEDRFNRRLEYPYALITEANVPGDVKELVNWLTRGRAKWVGMPEEMWGPPDFLNKTEIDESIKNIGWTMNYRNMCHFYSGYFWKHPAVAEYEWIWRLDTDVEFWCQIPYDPIARVRDAGALYGFVQVIDDALFVQPSLASNASAFLTSHKHLVPEGANLKFGFKDTAKALAGTATADDWTKFMFYNNWEISHRSLWESELYTAYFDFLDKSGGFYYERWGDAPVHSLGIAMMLRPEQVVQFKDQGYQHQGWAFDCPPLDRCGCTSGRMDDRGNDWFNAASRKWR